MIRNNIFKILSLKSSNSCLSLADLLHHTSHQSSQVTFFILFFKSLNLFKLIIYMLHNLIPSAKNPVLLFCNFRYRNNNSVNCASWQLACEGKLCLLCASPRAALSHLSENNVNKQYSPVEAKQS